MYVNLLSIFPYYTEIEPNNVESILDVGNNLGDCPNKIENGVDVEIKFGDWKPGLGMSFNSEQAAYNFYNTYGGRIIFSVRKV